MTDELRDAFRAVRDRYDGEHPQSDATLRRALLKSRALDRKRRMTRWVVLPIAAALCASTAWASVTGRLPRAISSLLETEHPATPPPPPPPPPPPVNAPAPVPVHEPPVNDPPKPEPKPEPTPEPEAPPVAPAPAPAPTPSVSVSAPSISPSPPPPKPEVAVAPTASANDPNFDLFAKAHHIHFVEKDPQRAVAAWDAYLAAGLNGRFAPEARYNRALALVRLGRHAEAKKELEAFSNGAFGDYRREEARALLGALARDE